MYVLSMFTGQKRWNTTEKELLLCSYFNINCHVENKNQHTLTHHKTILVYPKFVCNNDINCFRCNLVNRPMQQHSWSHS